MMRRIMLLVLIGLLIVTGCTRFQGALEVATDPRDPMLIYPSYQSGVLLERRFGEVMEQRGAHEVVIVPRHRYTAPSYGYGYSPSYNPPYMAAPDQGGAYGNDSHGHKKAVCIKKWREGRRERIERIEMTLHEWAEWSRTRQERERRFGREGSPTDWRCEFHERRDRR